MAIIRPTSDKKYRFGSAFFVSFFFVKPILDVDLHEGIKYLIQNEYVLEDNQSQ